MHARGRQRILLPASAAVAAFLTAACGNAPSTLEPRGPGAHRIATLWWFMFIVSTVVVLVVGALLLCAVVRRGQRGGASEEPGWARGMIFGGGVAFPIVVLTVLWV